MNRAVFSSILTGIAGVLAVPAAFAADGPATGKLEKGDYVAIVGDSITEQKQYSVIIEDYLLMCKPASDLSATQFGWGGETAGGFGGRMKNDMLPFGATVATTCFGMNDGGYSPQNPGKAKGYHDAQTSVVEQMKKGGVRFIIVGSPGCVDSDTFRKDPAAAKMYNLTLASERDISKKVAEEQGVAFADVFEPMVEVMEKAKAKYGHDYPLAGGDGVHPGANGHLVMAYAFLKAMGCDGNIGAITLDLTSGKASADHGHKVLSESNGTVEIESYRYPFCFFGDPKSPEGTTGVLEFFPFNQDLNRFTLNVTGTQPTKHYKVTWGKESKDFSGDTLAKGINLAAEFLQNPFAEAFQKVDHKVRDQQNVETPLVKQLLHDLPMYENFLPDEKEMFAKLRPALVAKDKPLRDESEKSVAPVKHSIKVEEIK